MILSCYTPNRVVEKFDVFISPIVRVLQSYQSSDKGVLVRRSHYVDVDNSVEVSKFNSRDFAIANLIEVGATNMLKPVYMSSMSDMTVADQFDNFKIDNSDGSAA